MPGCACTPKANPIIIIVVSKKYRKEKDFIYNSFRIKKSQGYDFLL